MESVNLNIRMPQDLVVWLRQQADKETRSLSKNDIRARCRSKLWDRVRDDRRSKTAARSLRSSR